MVGRDRPLRYGGRGFDFAARHPMAICELDGGGVSDWLDRFSYDPGTNFLRDVFSDRCVCEVFRLRSVAIQTSPSGFLLVGVGSDRE